MLDRLLHASAPRSGEAAPRPPATPDPASPGTAWSRQDRPWLARLLAGAGLDVRYQRGRGCWLEHTVDGRPRRVLDLAGGFGAAFLGHAPPHLVEVARTNLEEATPMLAQASLRDWSGQLARRLCTRVAAGLGGSWVAHLLSTGSEAVDAAMRHALLLRAQERRAFRRRLRGRLHALGAWYATLAPAARRAFLDEAGRLAPPLCGLQDLEDLEGRLLRLAGEVDRMPLRFVAVAGAYHGSTLGGASLSRGRAGADGPLAAFVSQEDPEDLGRLLAAEHLEELEPVRQNGGWRLRRYRRPRFAAFFFEPVQGEGGVRPLDPGVVREWLRIAGEYGLPVVADEIQTGLGRCGAFLAVEPWGLRPDAVLLGKTLGGGLAKVTAALFRRDRYVEDFALRHGSTFGDDDPSSRVALGVLDLLAEGEERRLRHARRLGRVLLGELQRLQQRWPSVLREVRGRGLLLGLELASQEDNPSPILRGLDEAGQLAAVCAGWLLWEEAIRVAPMLHAPRVLRLQPPVATPAAELRRAVRALDRLCALVARGEGAALLAFLGSAPPRPLPTGRRLALTIGRHLWEARGRDGLPLGPPPASRLPREPAPGRRRVAFLCHWIDPEAMRHFAPELAGFRDAELARITARAAAWLPRMVAQDLVVASATGREVECRILGWMALPEDLLRLARGRQAGLLLDAIQEALGDLADQGCSLAGFGGFTSVVTRSGLLGRHPGLGVTTGNALTLGMALHALEPACREQGLDLARERVAVVGAAGNIGRLAARMLQPRAGGLVLVGHPRQRPQLEELAGELAPCGRRPKVLVGLTGLRGIRVVFSATSATRPILDEGHFDHGPGVLLDLAVPADAAPSLARTRPRLRIIRGGIVRLPVLPERQPLELPGWHLPPGHVHACLAETLLLGLEGRSGDFAVGPLREDQVREALTLAAHHGFALGLPQEHCTL